MYRFQPTTNSSKLREWGASLLGEATPVRSRASSNWAKQRGFSIIEVTVILVTAAILSGVLVASVSSTINSGRIAKASADQTSIILGHTSFNTHTGMASFNVGGTEVDLLVSSGDIPGLTTSPAADEATWLGAVNNTSIDLMERHLSYNNPGGSGSFPYTAGAGGWRGSYLQAPVAADPWGNRYAVNAEYLDLNPVASDVVVISAGPNEIIETVFTGSLAITAGGDDIITAF